MVDDFEAYRTDRSTSHIEPFNNVLAAFADKRDFFNIKALKLRHILTVRNKSGTWQFAAQEPHNAEQIRRDGPRLEKKCDAELSGYQADEGV